MPHVYRTTVTALALALTAAAGALGAGCSDTPPAAGCETSSECGSVASARILEYDAGGTLVGELAAPGEKGRMAYAPDGFLYYLVVGWPTRAEVQRFALPATR